MDTFIATVEQHVQSSTTKEALQLQLRSTLASESISLQNLTWFMLPNPLPSVSGLLHFFAHNFNLALAVGEAMCNTPVFRHRDSIPDGNERSPDGLPGTQMSPNHECARVSRRAVQKDSRLD